MDSHSYMIFDSFRDSIRTLAVGRVCCYIDDMLHFLFVPSPLHFCTSIVYGANGKPHSICVLHGTVWNIGKKGNLKKETHTKFAISSGAH